MDLSKLPRLSKTQQPAGSDGESRPSTAEPGPPPATFSDRQAPLNDNTYHPPASAGAEAWIGIVLGAILIIFFPRIWQYYLAPGSFTWTFVDKQGAPLAYTRSAFFMVDLGLTVYAIILVMDGLVMLFSRRIALVAGALGLTLLGTALNFIVLVLAWPQIGPQLMPLLAAALGVYIGIYQWNHLRMLLAERRA